MYLCRAAVVRKYEVKGCYVCGIARCRRPSWDEALLNVPSVSIATLWGKIEDGDVVRLCTSRSHPVDPIPVPSRLHLITARSATFSAGASFNYHFDLEEKRKEKNGGGGGDSGLTDKNAKVGMKRAEVLTRGAAKIMQIGFPPPRCRLSPWVVNGLPMT